ncbi:MAG: glycoside hydrolase family 13 protein [Chitinophagaceae bacterium]|nr:glycoside hydrolase family 13 protein [Bacteroidota bacterium]MCC6256777.1 glycoside hydrolase family 13 protein [Chitinophagaceae bacterium]
MKKIFFAFLFSCICLLTFAQDATHFYPTHWWAGMKWNKIQVMVHGNHISDSIPMVKMGSKGMTLAPGISLTKIHRVENPNYVFLDITIAPNAKPGTFKLPSANNWTYELKPRRKGNGTEYAQGLNTRDLVYLIMPDRFSNGDESNDRIPGMRDQSLNRDTVFNRHGGDLKGIQNHLDYLSDLGVTTLWLNPIIENDMPNRTEHGYAFTNHYKVDPRLGGDNAYRELINAVHKKGMKIFQDAVYNHVGSYHFTVLDLPMKDWLHQWPKYTQTNYKDQAVFDPHASEIDKKIMEDGWFTREMPDLNQNNPYVANFLIQHALWTVEEFGIDGWRIDTYGYNDLPFMNRCNKALTDEYPHIFNFGETWVHGVPNQSYFCRNNYCDISFKSNLQSVTDFQCLWGITDALTKDFGWTDGVNRLYTTLAQDFVYKDPTQNVIFLDNHDLSRFFSVVGENMDKYLSGLTWLLTSRGIPQIYYGDEIATTGTTQPTDGYVRLDFPGGWKSDPVNKFTIQGRTQKDQEIFQHFATLANFRKTSPALTAGKLMQYAPEDGVYVYFRFSQKQTVMVIMNTSKEEKNISLDRFTERTNGFSKMKNIITGEIYPLGKISLKTYQSAVFELLP